jgi:hypothetical protein
MGHFHFRGLVILGFLVGSEMGDLRVIFLLYAAQPPGFRAAMETQVTISIIQDLQMSQLTALSMLHSGKPAVAWWCATAKKTTTKNDYIVVGDQSPHKARILMALALLKTSDTKELQDIFWKY